MANKFRLTTFARHYEQTLYLDCDVVIRPNAPDIFERVPVGKWGLVDEKRLIGESNYHRDVETIAKRFGYDLPDWCPNGGVMIVPQNCDEYLPPETPFPVQWCFDQSWLACRLKNWVAIDDRFNWMHIRKDYQAGLDDAWFVHLNGTSKTERLEMLQKLVESCGMQNTECKMQNAK